ncbi:MAG: restriction endonuclease subunit S [Christensenellaceae bacterium]|mgnify:FL=1
MKYKLGDICEIVSGSTPKTGIPEYWDGDKKWITPAEINEESYIITDSARKLTELGVKKTGLSPFPEGTVILSSRAPIGKVAIAGCEMYCNQGFKNLICSEKINNRYLYWFLKGNTEFLNSLGRGATFKEVSKQIVSNIEINVPSIAQQEQAAIQLETANAIIRFRKQQLQKLDELVKARFVEMFGMPGTDVFGWGLVPLGSASNINPKKIHDSRLVSSTEVSFVPMSAVTERGEIDATAIKEYDEVKTGFTYFAENDVLFAKITPCMENGKGAVAKGLRNGIGFGSTEFHVLRPIVGKTDPYWIYTLTAFSQFRMDASNNMTGSAGQRRVPASFLENYRVSLPPIALQEQFAAFVEQTDKSKLAIQQSLDKLKTLRKSLMQEYYGQGE